MPPRTALHTALRSAPIFVLLSSCGVLFGCGGTEEPPPPIETHECPAVTGMGTTHQVNIDADETWTAAANPHVITFGLRVQAGTLTIEPCAVVRIQPGHSIIVGSNPGGAAAALVAHGEVIWNSDGSQSIRPVMFQPDQEGTHWGSIRAFPTGRIDLELATLRGGGEQSTAQNSGGTLIAIGGGGPTLERNVRVVSVTIDGSGGFGANLQSFAAFTEDSRDLIITGSGRQPSPPSISTDDPILIAPPAVQTIPMGDYTGNKVDAIQIFNQVRVETDETFRDRGVPYRLPTSFAMSSAEAMAAGGLATLTLEAGVTLKLLKTPGNVWSIRLGTSNGTQPENLWPVRLIAEGTAEKPIVITSASETPAAGDWGGIQWRAAPSSGNVIKHMRLEYGGGDSGTAGFGCGPSDNDAALVITNWRPDSDFIDDLTIMSSESGGIVSGWMSDEEGPDLKDGNTFTGIGSGCDVSRWANLSAPTCPGNDSVPDCL
ncbi:MAG: hypothetical protein IT384_20970 [Deltaproteobacteria bacterium]|nr:hypothetical protein [Deltaproteobacteria bacterium]